MIVRDSQIAVFEGPLEAAYTRSAVNYLAAFDPVLAAWAGREGLEQAARNGLTAARKHDLASGPALQLYLGLMASLGSSFDEDPQYAWLGPFLDHRQDMGSLERARFLHFHASAYIRRAYGATNEFAREAVERALDRLESLASPSAPGEMFPLEALKWLHLQRLDFVNAAAANQLAGEARKTAKAAGLPMPRSANVILILIFLFGYKVSSDPLYPWVEALLKGKEPGADRLNLLVEETRKHLAAILSYMTKERC